MKRNKRGVGLLLRAFHALQLRHDDDGNDDEQKPRTDFADMDKRPSGLLIRILPGAEERRDVFGNPDEKTDKQKGQDQGHFIDCVMQSERHSRPEEDKEQQDFQAPADVVREMMRKKVRVNQETDGDCVKRLWPIVNLQVETPP